MVQAELLLQPLPCVYEALISSNALLVTAYPLATAAKSLKHLGEPVFVVSVLVCLLGRQSLDQSFLGSFLRPCILCVWTLFRACVDLTE